MNFKERKIKRIAKYIYNKELKTKSCSACNGSGYYDHNKNPKCNACNGTGKEKYKEGE